MVTSVCTSVRPSHSQVTLKRFKILKYLLHFRLSDFSSFLMALTNFVVLNLGGGGSFRMSALQRPCHPLSTSKIWPVFRDILEKRCEIGCQLVLCTNRKSRIRAFYWYQNRWPWMTLNGVMAVIRVISWEFGGFEGQLRQNGSMLDPHRQRPKRGPKNLLFSVYNSWPSTHTSPYFPIFLAAQRTQAARYFSFTFATRRHLSQGVQSNTIIKHDSGL